MNALLDEGDSILVPRPGFSLYEVLAASHGARVVYYNLLPENNWQADLKQLENLVDSSTRALLINNPSNPCGSVYPKAHLAKLVAIAERHRLPILADEIYCGLVFEPHVFQPLAELSPRVPVVTVGGLAKQFVVPGWRVGWLMLHDPVGAFGELREGLNRLTTLIVGANTLVQAVVPAVLTPAEGSAEEVSLDRSTGAYLRVLQENAAFTDERLRRIPGLLPVTPQGAMYVMVSFDPAVLEGISDGAEFCNQLLSEEAVFVLPGGCFGAPNFFRVVLAGPREKLGEAYDRIEAFCRRRLVATKAS